MPIVHVNVWEGFGEEKANGLKKRNHFFYDLINFKNRANHSPFIVYKGNVFGNI